MKLLIVSEGSRLHDMITCVDKLMCSSPEAGVDFHDLMHCSRTVKFLPDSTISRAQLSITIPRPLSIVGN